jgi:uncharacterized protein DUF4386
VLRPASDRVADAQPVFGELADPTLVDVDGVHPRPAPGLAIHAIRHRPYARSVERMTTPKKTTDRVAVTGLMFVGTFVGGLIGSTLVGPARFPSPFDPPATVERYAAGAQAALRLMATLNVLSALALGCFAAVLAVAVRRADSVASRVVIVAGTAAATFLMVSGLCTWMMTRPASIASPAVLHALHDLNFMTGGVAHVVWLGLFVGAASLAALSGRFLPSWIAWWGVVVGVVSLASVTSLLAPALSVLLPVGRFPALGWVIAASVTLLRARRQQVDAPHRGVESVTVGGR